jgi:hypothetical protein
MFCKIVLPSSEIHKLPSVPKTFDDLNSLCQKKYAGKLPPNPTFKYKDSDEELITLLNDEDLETAILTHEQEKIKTLRLFIVEGESLVKPIVEPEKKAPQDLSVPQDKAKNSPSYFEEKYVKSATFKKPATYSHHDKEDEDLDHLTSEIMKLGSLKRSVSHNSNYDYDDVSYPKALPKNEGFSEEHFKRIEAYIDKRIKDRVDAKLDPSAQEIINRVVEEVFRRNDDKFNVDSMMRNSIKKPVPKPGMNPMSSSNSVNMRGSMKKSMMDTKPYFCDGCKMKIEGVRYSCTVCQDFDFCDKCEQTQDHPHQFIKYKSEAQPQVSMQPESSGSDFLSKIKRVDPPKQGIHFDTPKGPSIKKFAAKIVREPIYDVMRVKQGKSYNIVFTLKNSGEQKWPEGVRLTCVGGIHDKAYEPIGSLDVNLEKTINLNLQAPEDVGKYASHWRLQYPEENGMQAFGSNLFFEVHVIEDKDRDFDDFPELKDLDKKMIAGKILKFFNRQI